MILEKIDKKFVIEALRRIDLGEIKIPKRKQSLKYDIFYRRKRYPEKFTFAVAYELATGFNLYSLNYLDGNKRIKGFISDMSMKELKRLKFKIVNKQGIKV